jgi:hypothetical protein
MTTKYQVIDVWWCSKCDKEWKRPSVPHDGHCPACGTLSWWRRFASQAELTQAVRDQASK